MTGRSPHDVDADLEALDLGFLGKAALVLSALGAASSIFSALQIWMFMVIFGIARFVPAVFFGLAVAVLFCTSKAMSSYRFAVGALVLDGLLALVMGGWTFYTFTGGIVAPLPVLSTVLAGLATVVMVIAHHSFRLTADAKKRLADAGVELGF